MIPTTTDDLLRDLLQRDPEEVAASVKAAAASLGSGAAMMPVVEALYKAVRHQEALYEGLCRQKEAVEAAMKKAAATVRVMCGITEQAEADARAARVKMEELRMHAARASLELTERQAKTNRILARAEVIMREAETIDETYKQSRVEIERYRKNLQRATKELADKHDKLAAVERALAVAETTLASKGAAQDVALAAAAAAEKELDVKSRRLDRLRERLSEVDADLATMAALEAKRTAHVLTMCKRNMGLVEDGGDDTMDVNNRVAAV